MSPNDGKPDPPRDVAAKPRVEVVPRAKAKAGPLREVRPSASIIGKIIAPFRSRLDTRAAEAEHKAVEARTNLTRAVVEHGRALDQLRDLPTILATDRMTRAAAMNQALHAHGVSALGVEDLEIAKQDREIAKAERELKLEELKLKKEALRTTAASPRPKERKSPVEVEKERIRTATEKRLAREMAAEEFLADCEKQYPNNPDQMERIRQAVKEELERRAAED